MDFYEATQDPLVLQHIQIAEAALTSQVSRRFSEALEFAFRRGGRGPESHLEALFLLWWEAIETGPIATRSSALMELRSQYDVRADNGQTYRLDFAVRCRDEAILAIAGVTGHDEPKIAIELDGRDFHERTKKQVVRRDQRDRDLHALGWNVLHFSGSELVANPAVCVGEVLNVAVDAYSHFSRAVLGAFRGERRVP